MSFTIYFGLVIFSGEAVSLFHCNMKFFKELHKEFGKNVNRVMVYPRKFKEYWPHNEKTLQSST